ncbi:MAG: Class cytochrome family [Pyrinomonadaceae bacterium]|nr:Class cytochrome family [Pyrinomonadaceae bacterium]
MKLLLVLAATLSFAAITLSGNVSTLAALSSKVQPKEVTLGKDAKATGQGSKSVHFTHEAHATKPYSIDGKSIIGCAECHHTDQPKAALKGVLKTSEREEVLTTALLEKADSKPVKTCRECHAQTDIKPASWPANPEVTYPDDPDPITMTNEEAYHRNCNVCHEGVKKRDAATKAPVTCVQCHNGK